MFDPLHGMQWCNHICKQLTISGESRLDASSFKKLKTVTMTQGGVVVSIMLLLGRL